MDLGKHFQNEPLFTAIGVDIDENNTSKVWGSPSSLPPTSVPVKRKGQFMAEGKYHPFLQAPPDVRRCVCIVWVSGDQKCANSYRGFRQPADWKCLQFRLFGLYQIIASQNEECVQLHLDNFRIGNYTTLYVDLQVEEKKDVDLTTRVK